MLWTCVSDDDFQGMVAFVPGGSMRGVPFCLPVPCGLLPLLGPLGLEGLGQSSVSSGIVCLPSGAVAAGCGWCVTTADAYFQCVVRRGAAHL